MVRGEDDIMEELLELNEQLMSFPTGAHWFCPRRQDDDDVDYENLSEPDPDEDVTIAEKQKLIAESKARHDIAYKFSLILGLAPEVTGQMLRDYSERLGKLFTSCDKCVRNWHKGRKAYLKELSEQYDDDTVAELAHRLNAVDFHRLNKGLESAREILEGVPQNQRSQSLLVKKGTTALLALFESFCCVEFLKSEERLNEHFNFVFAETQQKKMLRISDVVPAMGIFLFDGEHIRRSFAKNAWEKMTSNLRPELFEWVVHDILSDNIARTAQPSASSNQLTSFWESFRCILGKMDAELIRNCLRGMEVQPGIYHLALQHLTCDSGEVLHQVIEAMRELLNKSPRDFWAAYGTISPATIAEQIFLSPAFGKVLASTQSLENLTESTVLAWTSEFVASLPPVQQFDACRGLLYHLLERLQDKKVSENGRLACCRAGLDVLRVTLNTFVDNNYKINPSTSLIVIDNVMGLVDKFSAMIMGCADFDTSDVLHAELKSLGMDVVSAALALDCKVLHAEYTALEQNKPIQRGMRNHSQPIWQAVLDIFRPGNLALAKSILTATGPLTGLDELRPEDRKKPQNMPEDHVQFNQDFRQLTENVSKVYERLSDFNPGELLQMYKEPTTARPLFAALLSSDQKVYEAAIETVKVALNEFSRQEAIFKMLDEAYNPMLSSLTFAVSRISKAQIFSPVPNIIKMGREVLHALCGNTGYLRTHPTMDLRDQGALTTWWIHQWMALDEVFVRTESWAVRVPQSTSELQGICRDCMEYAESLLDQYTVIASALNEPTVVDADISIISGSSKDSVKKVLHAVATHSKNMPRLLRLRDPYLVSVIVSLLVKLLRRLTEYDMEIPEYAVRYIKDSCMREHQEGYKRTNLTSQQKAELQRALDEHQGLEIIEEQKLEFRKQSTIDTFIRTGVDVKKKPSIGLKGESLHSKTAAEKNRTIAEKLKAQQAKQAYSAEAFRDKRRRDAEERKARDALAVANAKAFLNTSVTRGEGSGLKGIAGVLGKDHAPVRSEIMVGSSDEDSDESDEDETNAIVTKRKVTSKAAAEHEEARRRALKQVQGPVKKMKIQRSAKDLRARVEPNMDRLYLEILNWEIFHHGDEPPSTNNCLRIADKFQDLDLYKRTFGPLLISEVWRSLVTAKDENNFKPVEIKVLNRLSVDKFMEVSTTMPITKRELQMSERDIALLSRSNDPLNNLQEPHCLARVDRTTRKRDMLELTYRVSRDINADLLQCFVPSGKIFGVKIADMTTTQREFAALSSLEYYDLCTEVLEAKPSPIQKYTDEKTTATTARYKLNRGQAQAILSANDNDGFTLIQGPPGSGKTKTIVAMVGSLLTPILREQAMQTANRPQAPNGKPMPPPAPKKKLLICAPSNAAVDELVLRLKDGVQPLNGPPQKINVIRIGRSEAINASVKDVMLDELVTRRLEGDKKAKEGQLRKIDQLHIEAAKIKEQLNVIRPQMDAARGQGDKSLELKLQKEFDVLKRKQANVGSQIDEDKENGNTVSRENEINRRRFQQEIIDGAHVLCATLSGSGHDMFRNLNVEFETVIIDEAAQCIELSALIPLKYGCSKCILVGDPEQLPPTVLSRSAQSFGYEQSLFVRMQHNHPQDVHLLDTQYRMHPEISAFPSQQFYKSRLIDGDDMAKLREQPWHASTILGPYRFFDVKGIQTKEARGHSFINVPELKAAMQLYERLKTDYRGYNFKGKLGIITTYKAQLIELRTRFAHRYGDDIFEEIEFNTTDAFQGREREIIIFSCVRAKATGGIGFLGDIRRMNVGLTRAKSSLWVLGDSRSLSQGQFWNRLIEDAKFRDRYTGGDVMALLAKPTRGKDGQVVSVDAGAGVKDREREKERGGNGGTSKMGNGVPNAPTGPRAMNGSRNGSRRGSEVSMTTADGRAMGGSRRGSEVSTPTTVSNDEVEMLDAPSLPNSRRGPMPSTETFGVDGKTSSTPFDRKTSSTPKPFDTSPSELNPAKKRPREEDLKEEENVAKKERTRTPTPPPSKLADLEAALQQQAESKKPGPSGGPRPRLAGGVPPPVKRKTPVDPFIRKKPVKR